MSKGKKTPKEIISRILQLHKEGLGYRKIATNVGVCPATVQKMLKKYKLYEGPGTEHMRTLPFVGIDNPMAQNAPQPKRQEQEKTAVDPPAEDTSAKLTALKVFSSRQLIKELYNRGYRIEKDGLFVIEKKKVLVGDIINEV